MTRAEMLALLRDLNGQHAWNWCELEKRRAAAIAWLEDENNQEVIISCCKVGEEPDLDRAAERAFVLR